MQTTTKLVALGAMAVMTCAASAQTVQKKASAGAAKGEAYVEKGLASQGLDGHPRLNGFCSNSRFR